MNEAMDGLDAVAAAPKHHRVLLENEFVRVLETRIEPGEVVPLHTHRWPGACYTLSSSDILRRDERGLVTFDSRLAGGPGPHGHAAWLGRLGPHTLENVGSTVVHVITTEVKAAPGQGCPA